MFWKKKKPDEPFSFQTLTEKEKAKVIRCLKDEIKEIVETGGKVEGAIDGLHWQNISGDDELSVSHTFTCSLTALRAMIRGVRV